MALYARMTSSGEPGSPAKIPVHTFSVALREWSRGAVTRAQVIAAFNLDAGEQAEIDAIAAKYTSLLATQRPDYLTKIHDVFVLCEASFYTEAKAKTELGF